MQSFANATTAAKMPFFLAGDPPSAGSDQSFGENSAVVWQRIGTDAYEEFRGDFGECAAFVPAVLGFTGQPTFRETVAQALSAGYAACGVSMPQRAVDAAVTQLSALPSSADPDRGVAAFDMVLSAGRGLCAASAATLRECKSEQEFADSALNGLGNAYFFATGSPYGDDADLEEKFSNALTEAMKAPGRSDPCRFFDPLSSFFDDCNPQPPPFDEAVANATRQVALDLGFTPAQADAMAASVEAQGWD